MIVKPPNFADFVAPAAGESYVDPAFGTTIRRVSEASAGSWVGTEYSTVDAWNADDGLFVLVHDDHFALYGDAGFLKNLPVSASGEPRWARRNPGMLYFHDATGPDANVLKTLNVVSNEVSNYQLFSEYSKITAGCGEGDLSEDGNHLALVGDGVHVFLYEISSGEDYPPLAAEGLDSAYCTPDNNILVSDASGMNLFDKDGKLLRQVASANGHKDVTRDAGREVLVWTNSNDRNPIDACQNGIVKIDLETGNQTCLLSLDWSLAVHVSCPKGSGFVLVETYSDPEAEWAEYSNELLKVSLDGSGVTRLCHHRSRARDYAGQPRATISPDGCRVLFSSNMANPLVPNYSDVYEIDLGRPAPQWRRRRRRAL